MGDTGYRFHRQGGITCGGGESADQVAEKDGEEPEQRDETDEQGEKDEEPALAVFDDGCNANDKGCQGGDQAESGKDNDDEIGEADKAAGEQVEEEKNHKGGDAERGSPFSGAGGGEEFHARPRFG